MVFKKLEGVYEKTIMQVKINKIVAAGTILIALSGCVPVAIVGGGGAVLLAARDERGLGGVISDAEIATKIQAELVRIGLGTYFNVSYKVRKGSVLLTGKLKNAEQRVAVLQGIWRVRGVREVIDEMNTAEEVTPKKGPKSNYVEDSRITAQVRSYMMYNKDINSMHYSIVTQRGIVFILGNTDNRKEVALIKAYALKSGAREVRDYTKPINEHPATNE